MHKKNPATHILNQQKTKKKTIGLFYKINFFILLIFAIVLSYFVVLVSTEPKSIPFVTKKIESVLQEKFGDGITIGQSYISFTRYGTLKIAISNLKITHNLADNPSDILPANLAADKKGQDFLIPQLEGEFSLLSLILLRFELSKITIINPTIVIDNLQKTPEESSKTALNQSGDLSLITEFLSWIHEGKIAIDNFEIKNAGLLIKGQNFSTRILLKKSQIRTSVKEKILYLSSINHLSFDAKKNDVNFNANCQLFADEELKCDLMLNNFVVNSVAELDASLNALSKINATIDANASFMYKQGQMRNITFKAQAKKGDFEFLNFFSQKISFSNFFVIAKYDEKLGVLNLSEIKTDFADGNLHDNNFNLEQQNWVSAPHLEMSLLISGLKKGQDKKLDFYIRLQEVANDKMQKFWPVALNQKNIRRWVINHVKGGMIKDAYARFSLNYNYNYKTGSDIPKNILEDINSQVVFTDFNLAYNDNFPPISKISGIANFNMTGMKIAVTSGDVLNSKISEGLIRIDDFNASVPILKISGKSEGDAADGLKHANYQSAFAGEISKYLNGDAQNEFDIRIPLKQKIDLAATYISVKSVISGLKNPYLQGDIIVTSKKNFGSSSFITNIDLAAAGLTAKAFDTEKKPGVTSALNLIVTVQDSKKILLEKIILQKSEKTSEKTAVTAKNAKINSGIQKTTSKITGDIAIETAPFLITAIDFKNDNFGKNNYSFSYRKNKKTAPHIISLKGQQINLASFLKQKFLQNLSGGDGLTKLQISVSSNNLLLLHDKSVKNFYLSLNCENGLCSQALAKGDYGNESYGKKQLLNFYIAPNSKKERSKQDKNFANKNFLSLEGKVSDIGYLAEALGISNIISGGSAKISLKNKIINKKPALEGEIKIDSEITFYENVAVKNLSKDDLFSQVKDAIFSNNKTIFNKVKLQFLMQDAIINIQSLVANNYKIGITAKGAIDLKNDIYDVKGMIVPGFIINNLFGIGQIPIIGGVISGVLTGGEGGGLFGIRYQYTKKKGDKEADFKTNKISAFVPATINSLFDLI